MTRPRCGLLPALAIRDAAEGGYVPGEGHGGQGALTHDDRVNEFDGDVLGIRAPSAVAERDQLAAFAEPGRHGGAGATYRVGALHEGQASVATAGKGIGYSARGDWPRLPFTDTLHGCPTSAAPEKNHRSHVSRVAELLRGISKKGALVRGAFMWTFV